MFFPFSPFPPFDQNIAKTSKKSAKHVQQMWCTAPIWWLKYTTFAFVVQFTDNSVSMQEIDARKMNACDDNLKNLTIF